MNNPHYIAQCISAAENFPDQIKSFLQELRDTSDLAKVPVLGITGTGGAGKSSLVDELVRRFLASYPDKHLAIISVDPSKRKTGGALLGDRIRMNAINTSRVYMRSLATRQSNLALSKYVNDALDLVKASGFDLVILETSGIGQSDTEILEHSDMSLYVMTPEFGAATQLEKIDMLDFADLVALNKFDKRGALDALRDVRKQYMRNHNLWETPQDQLPVFGTIASQFNDPGMNRLYGAIMQTLVERMSLNWTLDTATQGQDSEKVFVIPPARTRYLSEISESIRQYDASALAQTKVAQTLYGIFKAIENLCQSPVLLSPEGLEIQEQDLRSESADLLQQLLTQFKTLKMNLDPHLWQQIIEWDGVKAKYQAPLYDFKVRDKVLQVETHTTSLSMTQIPKVALPRYTAWGDLLGWMMQENLPGSFPYTAGLYPFKRVAEDPTRMFAGEGGPERTNRRFHYLSQNMSAIRLSTAFDSVTLYGHDPDLRPDIYGKIGNAGVSVCCLDDAKKLYSGFDLSDPMTSVSMTINGPAPMVLAFFLNAAIDQNCEKHIKEHNLEAEVEQALSCGIYRPITSSKILWASLPQGHNGLGLLLLGITGDKVLPHRGV